MTEVLANANLNDELEQLLAQGLRYSGIIVSRLTLETAIRRFLSGEVNRQQLTTWANAVEAHDQVQYEHPFEKLIADILFELSSPEIHQVLDPQECNRLLGKLVDLPETFT
jgi:hypothetical protein